MKSYSAAIPKRNAFEAAGSRQRQSASNRVQDEREFVPSLPSAVEIAENFLKSFRIKHMFDFLDARM